jgi:hypothetical protein
MMQSNKPLMPMLTFHRAWMLRSVVYIALAVATAVAIQYSHI